MLFRSELILEEFKSNEFLSDFYHDRDRWSLGMQLSFLAFRRAQLGKLVRPFSRPIIGDYSNWKDGVFGRLLLRDRELRLFSHLDDLLTSRIVSPDVIVYLDAKNEVLLQRIESRGRPYETAIDDAYLNSLRAAYEDALPRWDNSNVLRYDTSRLDLSSEQQMQSLYSSIMSATHS